MSTPIYFLLSEQLAVIVLMAGSPSRPYMDYVLAPESDLGDNSV